MWESALACLVNLSHLSHFRPVLGNAGAVVAIVRKLDRSWDKEEGGVAAGVALTEREFAHCVTALCLYCRESVNR